MLVTPDGLKRLFRLDGNFKDEASEGKDLDPDYPIAGQTSSGIGFEESVIPYGSGALSRQVARCVGHGRARGDATGLPSTGERTIAGWFKLESGTKDGPFGYGFHAINEGYWVRIFGGDYLLLDQSGNWGSASGVNPIKPNTWYHVAYMWDGSNNSFYLNGNFIWDKELTGNDKPATRVDASANVAVCGNIEDNFQTFKGWIADFAIFDRALTADEVSNIYKNYDAFVAPPTTYIPTKTPILNPTETPISKDPTSEPTTISLEDLWKIVPGSNKYENSKFSFIYEIHKHHQESNLRAVVLDKECTNPTNLNHTEVPSAFIPNVTLISPENALVEITLNTSQIVDLGSNYFEYRENGDASVYFCLRFVLFDGGEEVNFVDSVAQLDVSLTDRNFTVTGLKVSPKDKGVINETDVFTVTVEYCDSAGKLLSNVVLNQGQSIKVCVSVDDQTTIIEKLFDFSWKKDDDGEYSQVALDNDGNAERFSSLSCNGLSAACSFETLLTAQFYTSTSNVTGRGSALLKFYTGRRAMSRILLSRSVQDSGSETTGVATMSTPQLTTASYAYEGSFISSGLSHSPFKAMMVFTLTSSLLLRL